MALQLGHRVSVDLDLFTHHPFEADALIETLRLDYQVQPLTVTNTICISVIEGIKVDFVHFKYPFSFPLLETEGVRLADMRDVAPMKLDAGAAKRIFTTCTTCLSGLNRNKSSIGTIKCSSIPPAFMSSVALPILRMRN